MAATCAFTVASDTPNWKAICLLNRPSDSIISTRICCGVSIANRAISSAVSVSAPARSSTLGGVQAHHASEIGDAVGWVMGR
ncbi:MAG TPA: hypothetical protein VFC29_04905 [Candidatus Limnocylindrales bacterium]|nr:hypothetical protein [Candidatus Limnocylindrales bacterium]